MTVTRKKAAAMLRYWNLENAPITPVSAANGDWSNAFFVGEDYVLKCTGNSAKWRNHKTLTDALSQMGISAPVVIPTREGAPAVPWGEVWFYLTKRVQGEPLTAREIMEHPPLAARLGECLGLLHRALEKVEPVVEEPDLLATLRDWALPRLQQTMGLEESFCRRYLEEFSRVWSSLPRQIIHRDPNPGNVIRQGEGWGFVDFELSQRNLRIYDPCYAATALLSEDFHHREQWLTVLEALMAGYDRVVSLTEEEKRAIPLVILANQFVCTAWFSGESRYEGLYHVNRDMTLWLREVLQV